jgi:hypothetical protein
MHTVEPEIQAASLLSEIVFRFDRSLRRSEDHGDSATEDRRRERTSSGFRVAGRQFATGTASSTRVSRSRNPERWPRSVTTAVDRGEIAACSASDSPRQGGLDLVLETDDVAQGVDHRRDAVRVEMKRFLHGLPRPVQGVVPGGWHGVNHARNSSSSYQSRNALLSAGGSNKCPGWSSRMDNP